MTSSIIIRARRAAGETLRSIAEDYGISTTEVWRKQHSRCTKREVLPTERSYVVYRGVVGHGSFEYHEMPISLSRNATTFVM